MKNKNFSCNVLHKKNHKQSLFVGTLALLVAGIMTIGTFTMPNASQGLADVNANQINEITQNSVDLHPNDPVIYESASGIQIKVRNDNSYLSGYPYITMGIYDNSSINWFIMGVSQVDCESSPIINSDIDMRNVTGFETASPCGKLLAVNYYKAFYQIPKFSTLTAGTILCISENNLGTSKYESFRTDASPNVLCPNTNALYSSCGLDSFSCIISNSSIGYESNMLFPISKTIADAAIATGYPLATGTTYWMSTYAYTDSNSSNSYNYYHAYTVDSTGSISDAVCGYAMGGTDYYQGMRPLAVIDLSKL